MATLPTSLEATTGLPMLRRIAAALCSILTTALVLIAGAAWAAGPPLDDYVVYGENGVMIGVGSTITGLVGAHNNNATTDYAIRTNGSAQIVGDVRSGGDVKLANGSNITGTLTHPSGTSLSLGSNAGVGTEVLADPQLPVLPAATAIPGGCPLTNVNGYSGANGQSLTLAPGSYGTVAYGGLFTLTLTAPGNYYFNSISAGNGSTINAVAGAHVFVCGAATFGSVKVLPATLKSADFSVEVQSADQEDAFRAGGNSSWIGDVYAPNGGIHIGSGSSVASFNGRFHAFSIVDIEHGVQGTCCPSNPLGHVVVTELTCPADDPTQFSITASGTGTINNGPATRLLSTASSVTYEVTPGTWAVAQDSLAGWTQTDNTCTNLSVADGQTVTCTISTKNPSCNPGHLLVSKVTCPVNDPTQFSITATGTGLITGGATRSLSTANTVDYVVTAGTYSVVEDPVVGWTQIDNTCTDVIVGEGQTASCTITNKSQTCEPGHLIVQTETCPVNDQTAFSITATGTGTITGSPNRSLSSVSQVDYVVSTGTYSVTEDPLAGWTQTGNTCSGVFVAPGATAYCKITNRNASCDLGHLIVQTETCPVGDQTAFSITASGTGTITGSPNRSLSAVSTVDYVVSPGTYSVAEDSLAGWTQTGNTCSGVVVAAGQTATCTISNRNASCDGHLVVNTVTCPVNDQTAFSITASGTGTITGSATRSLSSTATVDYQVAPGSYSVAEDPLAGWSLTDNTCNNVQVTAGNTAYCTITNRNVSCDQGHLIVQTETCPVNDPTTFFITATGTGAISGSATRNLSSTSQVDYVVMAGTYSIGELGLPPGWYEAGTTCNNVQVSAGGTAYCKITNRNTSCDQGHLIVQTETCPVNDQTAFSITATGSGAISGSATRNLSSTSPVDYVVMAGTYSITEAALPGWSQTANTCTGVQVAAGGTATCTITNRNVSCDQGHLVVNTVTCPASDPTQFSITASGTGTISGSPTRILTAAASVDYLVTAGTYSIAEASASGWTVTSNTCNGVAVTPGQTATCTIAQKSPDCNPGHVAVTLQTCPASDPTPFSVTLAGTGSPKDGPATRLLTGGATVDYKVAPGMYSITEAPVSGWHRTGNTCNDVVVTEGQTASCTISLSGPACNNTGFCTADTIQDVLDEQKGRYPGNLGPDVVVDLRTESLQDALEAATDTNGDGYIIVGVVAQAGGKPGGSGSEEIKLGRAYDRPFALLGCEVTIKDPVTCDGTAPFHILKSATSPEFPAGSGVNLYIYGITASGSQSSPAWLVEGNGRFLDEVSGTGSMYGLQIIGDGNTLYNSMADANVGHGVVVQGNGNTVDTVEANANNGGDGIRVTGNSNTIANSTAGGEQLSNGGNGANGITVVGKGNLVLNNETYRNRGDGINVSGGIATNPNVVRSNTAGAPTMGNRGNGIVLGGTGSGASSPIELESNRTQSNAQDGILVTGKGHQLKNNLSGSATLSGPKNAMCQFLVKPGNINATGNVSNGIKIPGANGSPFPTSCK